MSGLPIHDVLSDLKSVLAASGNAVLVAPPGAGKTTAVAPALLGEAWCEGQILLLSPRRLATRAAAERIAELLGERPGETCGYMTRMDSRVSGNSRIIVMTEGIFRNRIIGDPELRGVSAVLFDEVHERSVDSDFGLALALEAQVAFRPDLRILPMSATLDGARFADLLGGAPVIESEGRSHPLEIIHAGRRAERPIEEDVSAAIRRALAEREGDILAFLPGVREIERTAERLDGISAIVHMLHGSLQPTEQRVAIRRDADGRRKVILATSIAETSLTIDGVRIVVDAGLARRPRHDLSAGVTRLVTERVSAASATQRAGRAARQGPGTAYRLWEEAATGGLIAFDPPEILESDLTSLLLDCAIWGEMEPANLPWLDPPPPAAVAEARKKLTLMGGLDPKGGVTEHGRALAELPLPPQLAHMLVRAAEKGQADRAAQVALLLQERGLGGRSEDIEQRLERLGRERGGRTDAARKMAARWADRARNMADVEETEPLSVGALLALAFPERVCRRRGGDDADWQSAGGRAFRLDPASPLARESWLAVADVQGAASGARILSAAALTMSEIETLFAEEITARAYVDYDRTADRVVARREKRLGAIRLSAGQDSEPSTDAMAQALLDAVRNHGLALPPWSDASRMLRQRAAYAGLDQLSDRALVGDLDVWLAPLLTGKRRLKDIDARGLGQALETLLGWDSLKKVERLAPSHFTSPAGTRHAIDYAAEAGPTVELRVQALFGLDSHPTVGSGNVPLILSLTSPAGRPIQTTRDLPGFWRGSWGDVRKDMRGRYPKHHWPEDPASAAASLATKKRQGL